MVQNIMIIVTANGRGRTKSGSTIIAIINIIQAF